MYIEIPPTKKVLKDTLYGDVSCGCGDEQQKNKLLYLLCLIVYQGLVAASWILVRRAVSMGMINKVPS